MSEWERRIAICTPSLVVRREGRPTRTERYRSLTLLLPPRVDALACYWVVGIDRDVAAVVAVGLPLVGGPSLQPFNVVFRSRAICPLRGHERPRVAVLLAGRFVAVLVLLLHLVERGD